MADVQIEFKNMRQEDEWKPGEVYRFTAVGPFSFRKEPFKTDGADTIITVIISKLPKPPEGYRYDIPADAGDEPVAFYGSGGTRYSQQEAIAVGQVERASVRLGLYPLGKV